MDATLTIHLPNGQTLPSVLELIQQHAEVRALVIQEERPAAAAPARPLQYGLSTIEWQMIELAVRGVTRSHIATQLCLSASSVSTYWARIYAKLGLHSRDELLAWYRTLGPLSSLSPQISAAVATSADRQRAR